jgi:hypothetical protein
MKRRNTCFLTVVVVVTVNVFQKHILKETIILMPINKLYLKHLKYLYTDIYIITHNQIIHISGYLKIHYLTHPIGMSFPETYRERKDNPQANK